MGMQKKKNRTKQVFSLAALLLMLITVFSCFSAAAASENEEQSNGTGKKYIIAMDTTFAPLELPEFQDAVRKNYWKQLQKTKAWSMKRVPLDLTQHCKR